MKKGSKEGCEEQTKVKEDRYIYVELEPLNKQQRAPKAGREKIVEDRPGNTGKGMGPNLI